MAANNTIALIVAAGRGRRFGEELPKQYQHLAGKAVLRRTVEAFLSHPAIDAVRVVIHPDDIELHDRAIAGLDVLSPVNGGETRQDSVRLGLESLTPLSPGKVLIHDAARPFVSSRLIDDVVTALEDCPAVLPCLPVVDTLKVADADDFVADTRDRSHLWRAQTPQCFDFPAILAAHRNVIGQNLTDDSAVAEAAAIPVKIVMGDEDNFKITQANDLKRAEKILQGDRTMRIGNGFDVHRFTEGSSLFLCGVEIPHEFGLKGHSDADVAMHALTDALLGAIGAGDIGAFFPPSDPQWKGVASSVFLTHAAKLVTDKGGEISNLDITIICERPKIGPYRQQMREKLAEILTLDVEKVSVKGTTTEKLGFTGRGEGIAAQAVALITLP